MTAYVLTRTANRPKMFARLRESLLSQEFPGTIIHVVHQERPSEYAVGDHVITGDPQPKSAGTAPWELHNMRLLEAVATLTRGTPTSEAAYPPGWVTFVDDDDMFINRRSLAIALSLAAHSGVMPAWRVERERGRLSPRAWGGDLARPHSSLCWEGAAHHTSLIGKAKIDGNGGADGRYWHQLSQHLEVAWLNRTITRPQLRRARGKGHGRRRDA